MISLFGLTLCSSALKQTGHVVGVSQVMGNVADVVVSTLVDNYKLPGTKMTFL